MILMSILNITGRYRNEKKFFFWFSIRITIFTLNIWTISSYHIIPKINILFTLSFCADMPEQTV